MPPSKSKKDPALSKKTKTKLSTLTVDSLPSFPSGSKHTRLSSTPLAHISEGSTRISKKPFSSFAKSISLQANSKGKDKAPQSSQLSNDKSFIEDSELWVDVYAPESEEELAVHKKKVGDVRRWLTEAFEGGPTGILKKYRRILALTGHAGTGKTTTLRVLAREMDFEILEWRNSLDDNFSGEGDDYDREPLIQKFQTFLTRASTCRALPFLSKIDSSSSTAPPSSRQIILLEDLPNILHAGTADAFHDALEEFISLPPEIPLVCVVSDAGTRGEDPESDMVGGRTGRKWGKQAVDVRSVIPTTIFNSPYFTEIQFNPVASTLMQKALTTLLTKHFSISTKCTNSAQPTKDIIQIIADSSYGDIRSAVMALQFACVVQLPKGKKKSDARGILEAVTRREQSLALFHMLGKVLYNKRKGDPPNSSTSAKDREKEQELDARIRNPPPLPSHLAEHARRASRVDVDMLYADSPIDTSLFALYLHHNYTQFCDEVDECENMCDWLSWIDASGPESWQAHQNPHQFHILTLGALHSLPSPVPRRSQKMFKPEYFDMLKKARKTEEGIADTEQWINSAISEGTEGARRWGKEEVISELGGVLKALDASGVGGPLRTHSTFTTLTFVHPTRMPSNSQRMHQLDEGEEVVNELAVDEAFGVSRAGGHFTEKERGGGWLEEDDIQDF